MLVEQNTYQHICHRIVAVLFGDLLIWGTWNILLLWLSFIYFFEECMFVVMLRGYSRQKDHVVPKIEHWPPKCCGYKLSLYTHHLPGFLLESWLIFPRFGKAERCFKWLNVSFKNIKSLVCGRDGCPSFKCHFAYFSSYINISLFKDQKIKFLLIYLYWMLLFGLGYMLGAYRSY